MCRSQRTWHSRISAIGIIPRKTIKGVTLKGEAGEVLCLLDLPAPGKTTLLRIAAGIEKQTGGRLLLNDRKYPALPSSFRRSNAASA